MPSQSCSDKKRYAGLSFGSPEDAGKLDFKVGQVDGRVKGL